MTWFGVLCKHCICFPYHIQQWGVEVLSWSTVKALKVDWGLIQLIDNRLIFLICILNIHPQFYAETHISCYITSLAALWWTLNWHLMMLTCIMLNIVCLSVKPYLWQQTPQPWPVKSCGIFIVNTLRPRQNGRHLADKTTFSNAFSWMKMYAFHLKFNWNLLLRVQLIIFAHWFR